MRRALSNYRGVQFGSDDFITDLVFADDCVFFAENDTEASSILANISNTAKAFGLLINADKTKCMTSDGSPTTVHLEGATIDQVQAFKYLGSFDEEKVINASMDASVRIGLATSAFHSLANPVWNRREISLKTKMRLFRTLILTTLLYGCESWVLLQPDLNQLETFLMRCLRSILNVSIMDRIRNAEIRRRCDNQPPINVIIQKRRLVWFGHVTRMDPARLPYRLLWRSQPEDWKVARSAPRKRWWNLIEKDLAQVGKSPHLVRRIALDRTRYRTLIEQVARSTLDRFDG